MPQIQNQPETLDYSLLFHDISQAAISLKANLEKAQPDLYGNLNPVDCWTIISNNEHWKKLAAQKNHQELFESVKEQLNIGVTLPSLAKNTSPSTDATLRINDVVNSFLESLREPMKEYLKENRLPEWILPETALIGLDASERADIVAHVHSLAIPARSDNPHCPDMLLHNLGKMVDRKMFESIQVIFEHQTLDPCLLLSTSGSGKTRTILEGLTHHWGFYFVCSRDDSGLGSSDLSSMIDVGLPSDDRFTMNLSSIQSPSDRNNRLIQNRLIAQQHFSEVALARLAIFKLYLEVALAGNTRTYSEKDLKKMWLILQLKPYLGNSSDIFNELSQNLYGIRVSSDDIMHVMNAARDYLERIGEIIHTNFGNAKFVNLAIVMDESQSAAMTYKSAFMSGPDASTESRSVRPVLREIVRAWIDAFDSIRRRIIRTKLVITGTGLERDAVKDAIASTVLKHMKFYSSYITDSLDDRDTHRRYLQEYLPPKLLQQSAQFEHLFDRIRHWLRGRYRFTSEYISLLLQDGFKRPHTVLNYFINAAIECHPTDMCVASTIAEQRFPGAIPEIRSFPFDFTRLTEMKRGRSQLVVTLIQYVYRYYMTSMPPFAFTDREIDFVQHGFARYTFKEKDVKKVIENTSQPREASKLPVPTIELSEPLILLALALWANRNFHDWIIGPLHYTLCSEITTHDAVMGNGLEKYVAYYFATILGKKEGCRLGDILHFHGQTKLRNSVAQLVAVNVLRNCRNKDEPDNNHGSATILNELNIVPADPTKGDSLSQGAFVSRIADSANVPDLSHCTSVLGRRAQNPEQVMNWLLFRHRNAICFPDNHFGPDLIFVLKLLGPNPTYIWVVVQCKLRLTAKTLTKKSVQDSLDTLAPTRFYIDKNGEPFSPKTLPKLPERTLEAMSFLPNREIVSAGPYSVLRIICAFPAPVDLDILPTQEDEQESDTDVEDIGNQREEAGQSVTHAKGKFSLCSDPDKLGHPLATVNIEKMMNVMGQFVPEDKLAAILGEKTQNIEGAKASVIDRARALDREASQYIDQRKLTKTSCGIAEATKKAGGKRANRADRKKSTTGTAKSEVTRKAGSSMKRNKLSQSLSSKNERPVKQHMDAPSPGNLGKKRKRTTSTDDFSLSALTLERTAGTMKLRSLKSQHDIQTRKF